MKRSDRAAVSVIIPTYNDHQYLSAALRSVIDQTVQAAEVIVVDDGSARPEDCRRVTDCFSQVRLIRQANQGRSGARNTGLSHATSEFVAFLDADDTWHPDFLRRQTETMVEHSSLGLSFTAAFQTDEAGRPVRVEIRDIPAAQAKGPRSLSILRSNPTRTSGCLWRRSILPEDPFDPELIGAQDGDLILRTSIDHPVYYLKEPLYFYRCHRGKTYLTDIRRGREEDRLRVLRKAYARMGSVVSESLKKRLWAIACIENACLRCAIQDENRAREWIRRSLDSDPELFAPPGSEFCSSVAQFLENMYEFGTPPDRACEVLDLFLHCLPPDLEEAGSLRRRVLGRFFGVRTFGCYERGRPREAFLASIQAVVRSPSWLSNRGFVSTAARSLLGRTRVIA